MCLSATAPFEPKVAIVTGAGRGIGRATALALAARNVAVALTSRTSSALESVKSEINASGGQALVYPADVSDAAQVCALIEEATQQLGPVDVLVNNAAIVEPNLIVDTPDESWDRVLDVNLKAAFLTTKAVLPSMLKRRRGRVILVSSISGRLGTPRLASYCASKWGLIGFGKAAAEEAREHDVHVFSVCPGSVDTEMLRQGLPGAEPQMTPDDVAGLILYLATEAPAAMTGTAIDLFG
jgi:3-oxoacyl-[acyl-carrier protein] reductase